jgi:hypothetical protein
MQYGAGAKAVQERRARAADYPSSKLIVMWVEPGRRDVRHEHLAVPR